MQRNFAAISAATKGSIVVGAMITGLNSFERWQVPVHVVAAPVEGGILFAILHLASFESMGEIDPTMPFIRVLVT